MKIEETLASASAAASKPATSPATAPAPATTPATAGESQTSTNPPTDVSAKKPKRKPKKGRPRNYDLGNGIYRFSRSRMFHKKAIYKFLGKKTPKKVVPKKPLTVVKPIGGENNGGTRVVLLKKRRNYYPTVDRIKKRPSKKCFSKHKRYTRPSLTPGTICILVAGRHRGKRVVLLKVLKSGLLLVTGPFIINACPMRRVSQNYVIATSTKLNVGKVNIPSTINDKYFKRDKKKRPKKEEGDIFTKKKEVYKVSDQRKTDQQSIDKQVIRAIRKHPDKKRVFAYLSAMFGLRSSQYPHRLKF